MAAKKPGTGKANTKAQAAAKPAVKPAAQPSASAARSVAPKPPSATPAPVKKVAKDAKPTASSAPKAFAATAGAKVDRQRLIAETAYFIAESRGFRPGNALEDWLAAERSVDARLRG